ncbi:multi-copper polyphenol oxidoreductase laccase domain-containing protein [Ditylenchus destructor]|uniref:Multi-copper polyphenol oxidoreductase laccase domain-containing protein n=1 Tax=Ditylenchus destructor TaxID=166010 RepID=A0AAD4MJE0_9BILA|nr:multi-copper polyphenol oxidoreductase laccase domain-containing protein [Ditylenchus destructor]
MGRRGRPPTPELIENQRRAIAAVAPGTELVGLYQVHSADAVTVIEPWTDALRPHADALVTNRPGLTLGILTADCAPVLFADRQAGVIGAAHAGWKGALGGVTTRPSPRWKRSAPGARTSSPRSARASPRASYEVDEGFRTRFASSTPPTTASSPRAARAITSSISRRMSSTASPPPAFARSRRWARTPTRSPTVSIASAAPPIAQSPITAARLHWSH